MADEILLNQPASQLGDAFKEAMALVDTSFVMSEITALNTADAARGMNKLMDKFQQASSVMDALRAFDVLDKIIESYVDTIQAQDQQAKRTVQDQMKYNGFKRNGNSWDRRVMKDASLVKIK